MKAKALLLSAFAFAAITLGLSSCDKDEDLNQWDIIGSWKTVHLFTWTKIKSIYVNEVDERVREDESVTYTFRRHGEGETDDGGIFNWSVSGKTLFITFEGEEIGSKKYTIDKFTSSEMVISRSYSIVLLQQKYDTYLQSTFERVD
jgi:hypothetical protein